MTANEQIAICRKIKAGLPHTQKEAELYCKLMKPQAKIERKKPTIDFVGILMISMQEKERRDAADGELRDEIISAGVHNLGRGFVD